MNNTTGTTANSEQRYRVLIVDDDDDVREALVDELEYWYDVTSVATGRDAIRHLGESRFDAIISDQRMPGMSGVEVLDAARSLDSSLIRILLTGFLDADARNATIQVDAPYKIGKPWHDEVEVTLKRAFENRSRERALTSSVTDALAVAGLDNDIAGIDDDIAGVEGSATLAKVIVDRCQAIEGVTACEVFLGNDENKRRLAGADTSNETQPGWVESIPISADGQLHLRARGRSVVAREIVRFVAARALHWSQEDPTMWLARKAYHNQEAKKRLNVVSRRATLGTMTTALVHELASMVQGLQGAIYHMEDFIREHANVNQDAEVVETLDHAVEISSRMISLFRAMRTFVRSGDSIHRPCSVQSLIESSVVLCRGSLRAVADLEIGEVPDVQIDVNEPLFIQVIVNLLKNAAEASSLNGKIYLQVTTDNKDVIFTIRDHGAGVPPEMAEEIFDPFMTTKFDHSGSGLGLTISSDIVAEHGGKIRYDPADGGGAQFTVSVPIQTPPAG